MEDEVKASSVPHKPDIVAQACNHNTQEVGVGGSEVLGQPLWHTNVKVSPLSKRKKKNRLPKKRKRIQNGDWGELEEGVGA